MYQIKHPSYDYDVYPRVVLMDEVSTITIRPLGDHVKFYKDHKYMVETLELNTSNGAYIPLEIQDDGSVVFSYKFILEQEYYLKIFDGEHLIAKLPIYSVAKDLYERYPYIGDLHVHSNRSDGRQAPDIVVANYRKFGYDFMAVTDHHKYYGSVDAINAYKDITMDMKLFNGEEVQLPMTNVHIINFGGKYSINGLVETSPQCIEKGTTPEWRSADGKTAPDVITKQEYERQVREIADKIDGDYNNIFKLRYAGCIWVFNKIREANGLGIFCHPYWVHDAFQITESFTRYMLENHPFDAFEVLGGENYYEQNGFQASRYYDDRAHGIDYAIVGSTDSHNSEPGANNAYVARTLVLSRSMEHDELIQSIKDKYSVAFDGIANIFVGDNRLVRYGWFLMQNYFPLHDELCFEEGRLMKIYRTGSAEEREDAKKGLEFIAGRMDKFRKKFFGR